MQSNVSGHWTDDQLIANLYGVGLEDGHLLECGLCRERLSELETHRAGIQRISERAEPTAEFLARQRRQIYGRLEKPAHWWSGAHLRRWTSAVATMLVLGGGLLVYEDYHRQQLVKDEVSDAQLAEQVSSMAQDSEPQSTAPLKALFEE